MRGRPVVLVVEDNTELRHVLREALAAEGYDVLTARDGVEALEHLDEHAVDLFISDLTGSSDSDQTIASVKEAFPDVPIVAMAGGVGAHPALFFSAWEERRRYRTLSKPFRLGELLSVTREVLAPEQQAQGGA